MTRFYLPSLPTNAGVDITPGFAGWTVTTNMVRRTMAPIKTSSAMTDLTIGMGTGANTTQGFVQFISEPLASGIGFTTADTIKCYIRVLESAINDNINRQPICVKVYAADGTTLQATLKALGHIGPTTTEWDTTTAESRSLADGDVLDANYTTVAGDRLVVEVGGQVSSAGGTSVSGTMRFGDSAAADLDESEIDTGDDNPWFEISRTCTFQPSPQRQRGMNEPMMAAGDATMSRW